MGFVQAAIPIRLTGEIHIPVSPFRDLESPRRPLHLEHMPGFDLMNTGKRGGAGHHRLHQLVEEAIGGEATFHRRVCEQHLQLRAEHEAIRGHRPVLRLDPEAIAHQIEAVLPAIKQREGEFTPQHRQRLFQPLLLIEPQQDLGITLAAETNPLSREIGTDALEVIELPVVRHQHLVVFAQEGLPAP